jgi:hypothetical protein
VYAQDDTGTWGVEARDLVREDTLNTPPPPPLPPGPFVLNYAHVPSEQGTIPYRDAVEYQQVVSTTADEPIYDWPRNLSLDVAPGISTVAGPPLLTPREDSFPNSLNDTWSLPLTSQDGGQAIVSTSTVTTPTISELQREAIERDGNFPLQTDNPSGTESSEEGTSVAVFSESAAVELGESSTSKSPLPVPAYVKQRFESGPMFPTREKAKKRRKGRKCLGKLWVPPVGPSTAYSVPPPPPPPTPPQNQQTPNGLFMKTCRPEVIRPRHQKCIPVYWPAAKYLRRVFMFEMLEGLHKLTGLIGASAILEVDGSDLTDVVLFINPTNKTVRLGQDTIVGIVKPL